MSQSIREVSALVKSRLARSSKMKLMVWAGYFVAINPGPVTVIKPSKQPKQTLQYIYYYINFQIVAIIFRVSLLKYIDMFLMIGY